MKSPSWICLVLAGLLPALAAAGPAAERVNIVVPAAPEATVPDADPELAGYLARHFEAVYRMQETAGVVRERRHPVQMMVDAIEPDAVEGTQENMEIARAALPSDSHAAASR